MALLRLAWWIVRHPLLLLVLGVVAFVVWKGTEVMQGMAP